MSIFAEMECHFSAVSIAVYTALIHHFTCRLEARQALIYQLALGLTGENGKYNDSRAVHLYPPFFDITCSAKNYKIAPALTLCDPQDQLCYLRGETRQQAHQSPGAGYPCFDRAGVSFYDPRMSFPTQKGAIICSVLTSTGRQRPW